ncbi:hypothetical protein N9D07_02910, partial [Alphaproteobacteria bacterium]|nr:hypothetical protein [Alphaproteobacteria bacterium]
AQITRLLALPQDIRGYGPVKEKAYKEALVQRDALRETIKYGAAQRVLRPEEERLCSMHQ